MWSTPTTAIPRSVKGTKLKRDIFSVAFHATVDDTDGRLYYIGTLIDTGHLDIVGMPQSVAESEEFDNFPAAVEWAAESINRFVEAART